MKSGSKSKRIRTFVEAQNVVNILKIAIAKIRASQHTFGELLPGIEKFLCTELSSEGLSVKAEKKRLFFVERLEVLRLQQPPSLPPRPDSLAKSPRLPLASSSPRSKVPADQLAAFREFYLSNVSTDNAASLNNSNELGEEDIYEEFENANECDEVEPVNNKVAKKVLRSVVGNIKPRQSLSVPTSVTPSALTEDDLYEVPLEPEVESPLCQAPVEDLHLSDGDSDTSYESYDEEEVELDSSMSNVIYQNQTPAGHIRLPVLTRVRNKKKKKRTSKEDFSELSFSDLENVEYSGELYHCGTFSWSRRFCVISDRRFLCYKSDKDLIKPVLNVPLEGYSINSVDKEGKRSHIVKISHEGSKAALFSAESKDKIETWIQHLKRAASSGKADRTNLKSSDVSSGQTAASQPSDTVTSSTSRPSSHSGGEGGVAETSGTGMGGKTYSVSAPSPYDTKEFTSNKERRRISKQGSEKSFHKAAQWFGTFGRKKGEKKRSVFYAVEVCDFLESNPGVDMAGYVNILTDLGGPKKWCKRFCYIKNGSFICCKEISDEVEEFSLRLSGCEVGDAHETRRELAVKVLYGGYDKFIIEPADALEQGNWLSILIRETGCAMLYKKRPPPPRIPDFANRWRVGESDQKYENIQIPADNENVTVTKAEVNLCSVDTKSIDTDVLDEFLSTDDLYDEVYQNASENVMAFLENSHQGKKEGDNQQSHNISPEDEKEENSSSPPLLTLLTSPRPNAIDMEGPLIQSEDSCSVDVWYDDLMVPQEVDPDTEKKKQNKEDELEQSNLSEDEGEDDKNNSEIQDNADVTDHTTDNQCNKNVNNSDIADSHTDDKKGNDEAETDNHEQMCTIDKPAPEENEWKSQSSSRISSTANEETAKDKFSSLRRKILETKKKRVDLRAKKVQARKPADKDAIVCEITMIDRDLKSLEEELQRLQAAGSPCKHLWENINEKNQSNC